MGELFKTFGLGGDKVFGRAKGATSDSADFGFAASVTFEICSAYSFKKKLDLYLSTVPDIPCWPGFSNSLDQGDCLRWRTPRDGLADNYMQLNNPK